MPIAPKKQSALPTQATLADDDTVTGLDTSAATPAAKNVNFALLAIANYILGKVPPPSQAAAEAGEEEVPRLITMERLKQAILALSPSGTLHNFGATVAPLGTDDNTDGYGPGSIWAMPTRVWICRTALTNIAVWIELTGGSGGEGGLDEEAVIALIDDADPTTTAGDLIVRGASGLERFALDADGKVLGTVAGALAWVTMTGGEGGGLTESEVNTLIDAALAELPASLTNPMEEAGDLIVGGVDGAPGRVAAGAENRVLAVGSAGPAWLRRDHFYEREIYGENVSLDLSTHHHCFVVPTAGKIIWAEAESFVYTSNPSIALTVNGTPAGTYIYPVSGNGVTSLRAGGAHQSISVAGGDNVGVYIVDNGSYMSSTATGLRVGILFVPNDAS